MRGLKLREELTGKRAGGTIIDFNNRRGTGALNRSANGKRDQARFLPLRQSGETLAGRIGYWASVWSNPRSPSSGTAA